MLALTTNIQNLSFEQKPDYESLRKLLRDCIDLSYKLEKIVNPDCFLKLSVESKLTDSTNESTPVNNHEFNSFPNPSFKLQEQNIKKKHHTSPKQQEEEKKTMSDTYDVEEGGIKAKMSIINKPNHNQSKTPGSMRQILPFSWKEN